MNKVIERQGTKSVPYTRMYPRVIGGICEYCGVMNSNQPATVQYQLCPHFKEMGELRCTYCPETANPTEVIGRSDMKIHEHPDNPNKLVVVCDSYNCARAHEARFNRASS